MAKNEESNWLDLLGNPYRRRILQLLAFRPMYSEELARHVGISPRAIHKHLDRLLARDIVKKKEVARNKTHETAGRNLVYFLLPKKAFFTYDVSSPSCFKVAYASNIWEEHSPQEWQSINISEENVGEAAGAVDDFSKIHGDMLELFKWQKELQELDNHRFELLRRREDKVRSILSNFNNKQLVSIVIHLFQELFGRYGTSRAWTPDDIMNIAGVDYNMAYKLIDILENKLGIASFQKDEQVDPRKPEWKLIEVSFADPDKDT
jgi:predicted transcriptional regulator